MAIRKALSPEMELKKGFDHGGLPDRDMAELAFPYRLRWKAGEEQHDGAVPNKTIRLYDPIRVEFMYAQVAHVREHESTSENTNNMNCYRLGSSESP